MSIANYPIHSKRGLPHRLLINTGFTGGCWLWMGSVDKDGYGATMYKTKHHKTHRLFYELFKGAIPTGLVIDHLCRVRSCVNPDHMEAVTIGENIRRGNTGKNRWVNKRPPK